ncbi:MAG: nicotinate (nicotinamide) nucleotide adenylyltransferase [Planctomycetes bacterium]|nr:nicotinate (nicotinamide) nucleotide adenylyltransferase [Planctomycetota bacterium]
MSAAVRQTDGFGDRAAAATDGIAVLGGAFDPPHRSHVRIATMARDHLPVGEVRVMPAGDHPHKQGGRLTPAHHRLAMCRLAFAAVPGVVVDDREIRRDGLSFTVETLAELAAEAPGRRLFFLVGSDNLPLLPSWREHHRLLELATVVTWPRRGYPIDPDRLAALDLSANERDELLAHVLPVAADDVAATTIRSQLGRGEPAPDLDPAVQRYAVEHELYRP